MRKAVFAIVLVLVAIAVHAQNRGTIFHAILYETPEAIKTLIENGADVNEPRDDGQTPLHIAAWQSNDPEVFRVLFNAGAQIDPIGYPNHTPFEYILQKNNIELVRLFIDAGVDVRRVSNMGRTPLEVAAMYSNDPEIFRLLIRNGANINRGGNSTPLHSAVSSNKAQNATLLISLGANINARDNRGRTPLMNAARFYQCVDILIRAGANLNLQDNEGKTALIYSTQYGADPRAIRLLLNAGANVNLEDNTGRTALDWLDRNQRLRDNPVRRELIDRMRNN